MRWIASLPKPARDLLVNRLPARDVVAEDSDLHWFLRQARPEQKPPAGDWRVWLLLAGRGFGKLLDVQTPIATPSGWTTMGELRVGDQVFNERGLPCSVVSTSDIQIERTYRVRFSDGAQLVAGASHQWITWTHAARKAYLHSVHELNVREFPEDWPRWRCRRVPTIWLNRETVERALTLHRQGLSIRRIEREIGVSREALARHLKAGCFVERSPVVRVGALGPEIRTTDQIRHTLTYGKRGDLNHSIPLAEPLALPAAELPIDPYVLGVWLGDGSSKAAEITTADLEILALVESAGYRLGVPRGAGGRAKTWPVGVLPSVRDSLTGRFTSNASLHSALRSLGLIGAKRIPSIYLRASFDQRLTLLRGLMDSDGHAEANNGTCEYTSINRSLADGVMELAISLGLKPTMSVGRATLKGRDFGEKYRIHFTSYFPVFRLKRKAERQKAPGRQALRQQHRMIVAIEEIAPVPMRCIAVDSPNHLYLAGRAMIPTHNTRTGAEMVRLMAESGAARRIALVAPTAADVRAVMVEGESGLLSIAPPEERPDYEPSKHLLTWPNGAIATTYSADEPDRLRGPQHDFAWCDELAAWRYPQAWDMLLFGLRLGADPRVVVTTTPRPTRFIRELLADPKVAVTHGRTIDNRANLAPAFLDQIVRRYEGTRLGRQELDAELLDDVPGALWSHAMIDVARLAAVPDLVRIVVAIDPAVSSDEHADETGIVVAAKDANGHAYVLADISGHYAPAEWAKVAVAAYRSHRADRIVAEINNGGEMVEATLRIVDPGVPFTAVHAARGKVARAEPVAALYEQGRVHHLGAFPALEDQMCGFVHDFDRAAAGYSPDRVDALVWALTELLVAPKAGEGIFEAYRRLATAEPRDGD
jgi:predicted phage terminase large subunit-like protein